MSAVVIRTWAGSPSRMATREGPWDSPAVSQRSMGAVFHAGASARAAPSGGEIAPHPHRERRARDDADQRSDQHPRPERVVLLVDQLERDEHETAEPSEQEARPAAERQLP